MRRDFPASLQNVTDTSREPCKITGTHVVSRCTHCVIWCTSRRFRRTVQQSKDSSSPCPCVGGHRDSSVITQGSHFATYSRLEHHVGSQNDTSWNRPFVSAGKQHHKCVSAPQIPVPPDDFDSCASFRHVLVLCFNFFILGLWV